MKPLNPEIKLEVLISAYGAEGLRRIARLPHPQVDGVHYLVSWQPAGADVTDIPDELVVRDDFDLTVTETVGSACNRNNAIEHSTGPLLMISDDDLSYTGEQLQGVIAYFDSYKKCDLACFRYHCAEAPRHYPDKPFPLRKPDMDRRYLSYKTHKCQPGIFQSCLPYLQPTQPVCGSDEAYLPP